MNQALGVAQTISTYLRAHPEVVPYLAEAGFAVTDRTPAAAPDRPLPEPVLRRDAARIAAVLRRAPSLLRILTASGIDVAEHTRVPDGDTAAPAGADSTVPPDAAEPAPAAAGTKSPETGTGGAGGDLARVWRQLVAAVTRQAPAIGAHLQGSSPLALQGGELTIVLPVNPTARMVLTQPQVKDAIVRLLRRLGVERLAYVYADQGELLPPGEAALVDAFLTTVVERQPAAD